MFLQRILQFGMLVFPLIAVGTTDNLIYVVQPKNVPLANRGEIVLAGMYNLNNGFVGETGLSLSGLYHLNEIVTLEMQVAGLFNRFNADYYAKVTEFKFPLVKYYRTLFLAQFLVDWQLLYGKVSFFDFYLGDLSIYLVSGFGVMGLELPEEKKMVFNLTTPFGVSARLYFANHFSLHLDLRDNVQALQTEKNVAGYATASFSISHKVWAMMGLGYVF